MIGILCRNVSIALSVINFLIIVSLKANLQHVEIVQGSTKQATLGRLFLKAHVVSSRLSPILIMEQDQIQKRTNY